MWHHSAQKQKRGIDNNTIYKMTNTTHLPVDNFRIQVNGALSIVLASAIVLAEIRIQVFLIFSPVLILIRVPRADLIPCAWPVFKIIHIVVIVTAGGIFRNGIGREPYRGRDCPRECR